MTTPLEKAFAKLSQLSARDQNAFARWLLSELESDRNWNKSLRNSVGRLVQLAGEALDEHRHGRTRPLDSL